MCCHAIFRVRWAFSCCPKHKHLHLISIPEGDSHALLLDLCVFIGLKGKALLFTWGWGWSFRASHPFIITPSYFRAPSFVSCSLPRSIDQLSPIIPVLSPSKYLLLPCFSSFFSFFKSLFIIKLTQSVRSNKKKVYNQVLTQPWGGGHCYMHFTERETEVPKEAATCPKSQAAYR